MTDPLPPEHDPEEVPETPYSHDEMTPVSDVPE